MTYRVTLIPGDGIGREITAATLHVLEATGVRFAWDQQAAGADTRASRARWSARFVTTTC